MNDIDGKTRRRSDTPRKSAKTVPTGSAPVGDALRGVYQETVNETIPAELLDLLGTEVRTSEPGTARQARLNPIPPLAKSPTVVSLFSSPSLNSR